MLPVAVAVRVVMETVPPRLRTPVAPSVNPPAPDRAVDTVIVPERVGVPVIATFGIALSVPPVMVIPVPLKVCKPAKVEKVEASFAKLPLKVKVSKTALVPPAVSSHTAPLLRVTAAKFIALVVADVEAKLIVPLTVVAPVTVSGRSIQTVPPELIVTEPNCMLPPEVVSVPPLFTVRDPVWVMFAVTVTVCVLAMMTLSPAAGTVPPGHGAFAVVELQLPEPAVVIVAERAAGTKRTRTLKTMETDQRFIFMRMELVSNQVKRILRLKSALYLG